MKYKIGGLGILKRVRLLLSLLSEQLRIAAPVQISFVKPVKGDRLDSLWYGGEVAVIRCKGWTFHLTASGEVSGDLTDRKNPSHLPVCVSDRKNGGTFGDIMGRYLRGDRQLYSALKWDHPRYKLQMPHKNGWKCYPVDPSGTIRDYVWTLCNANLFRAVVEVVCRVDSITRGFCYA